MERRKGKKTELPKMRESRKKPKSRMQQINKALGKWKRRGSRLRSLLWPKPWKDPSEKKPRLTRIWES